VGVARREWRAGQQARGACLRSQLTQMLPTQEGALWGGHGEGGPAELLPVCGVCLAPCACAPAARAWSCRRGVRTLRERAGEPPPGAHGGCALFAEWAAQAEKEVTAVLASVAKLVGASHALAGALVRAGALGAAARLARRFAHAHAAAERDGRAASALSGVREVLAAAGRQLP